MVSQATSGRTAEIQDRDLLILRGLYEARVMTAEHIAAVYFDGRYEAARKRLQKLKAAGYVGERPRRVYDPAVLFLTRRAFDTLCQSGAIGDLPQMTWASLEKRVRVSPLTLQHELEVQDVRAAFYQAASQNEGTDIAEFSTWPAMYQFDAFNQKQEAVLVRPDGYVRLREITEGRVFEHRFFLELDRSSEPQGTLVTRAACYRDFYRRGGLAVRYGGTAAECEAYPFRVLIVFRTGQRRDNFARRLLSLSPPILGQTWLTTFAEVASDPLDAIWVRPSDYRTLDHTPGECVPVRLRLIASA